MALTDDTTMLVQPTGFANGGFGGDWSAWIIIFLIMSMNGWGNGFGGYGGMNQFGVDFPWLLNGQNGINANTNAGFQNAALTSQIGDIGTQIGAGFAGVTAQLNANQISDLERSFAAQTANTQGLNTLQSQLAQCCCDNRLATAQTQALVQSENCADRYEAAQNTASIISAITSGIQSIKDDLCADRLEAERRENANLRSELMFARGQASQDVQTAAIQAGQRALANEVEQYVLPTPRPAYIVQNPSCCNPNVYGCGCGA